MVGNLWGNSYIQFPILDIKFRFTCGKSDLYENILKFENIMTRIVVCFLFLKDRTCERSENIFYVTSKTLFYFTFSDIQISWHHQMPKHETQNTFHLITWEVNTIRPVYATLQNKKFYQTIIWKMWPGH